MDTGRSRRQTWGRGTGIVLAGLVGIGVVAADAAAPAWSAEYGVRNPRQNARQHRQDARIRQGVRSGELTVGEARTLGAESRAIRREERAFESDGSYTPAERAHVERDLNRLGRDIYREKHDAEVRPRGNR